MSQSKRKQAAALYYDPTATAPEVIASGQGAMAERIIERAKELGIPIQEDSALAPLLVGLKLNQEIPVELYTAVANVLSIILSLDRIPEQK